MSESLPRCFGLFGHPARHSASPDMHNAAFAHLGLGHHYAAFDIRPDELPAALAAASRMGYGGLNLTVPHKRAALELLDHVDEAAIRVGAVNTVVFRERESWGHNTDGEGFVAGVRELRPALPKRAVVLGGGGAARAVVHALLATPEVSAVDWVSRDPSKLPPWEGATPRSWVELGSLLEDCSLLVNATTVGMDGGAAAFPAPVEPARLAADAIVSDLVYRAVATPLVAEARAQGLDAQDGAPMLLWQGVRALELWLDRTIDPPVVGGMRAALHDRLRR